MNSAVCYLIEPLLTQFFLIDAVCGTFMGDVGKRAVFSELARIFCVPLDDEVEEYFAAAISDPYNSIADYAAYERLCRMIDFAEVSGQDTDITPIDRVVLAQKREAMLIKSDIFKQSKNLTAELIADTLLNTAMNGNIDAMITLSYMEFHGIGIRKDERNARKRLALCAKWNNLFGNLMGIAYDNKNRSEYYNRLHTIFRSSNQRAVFDYICDFTSYDRLFERNAVARIIEKAFGLGIIRRNTYDQIFAKVAFSTLVSSEDKEKLLLSKKQDAIVSLSDIPFDASRERGYGFDESKTRCIPLKRDSELQRILCGIAPAMKARNDLYRPILVASDDEYIADMYVSALKEGFSKGAKLFEVDAGALSVHDFAAAKENFILRGLSETKQSHTVFLVKHCEELGESELEEVAKLLDYEYRCKFKLVEPTVSLDLSDVLIVLFSSEINENVRKLADKCDIILTDRISDIEKKTVIESTFGAGSRSFGIENASLDEKGRDFLMTFETGKIARIIEGALKKAIYDGVETITAEMLKAETERQAFAKSKREFGYLGGAKREKC